MKKSLVLCAGLCVAFAFTSCKSSESAYKKAYEKAKAQEQAQSADVAQTSAPIVTPLEQKPATQTTVVDNADNAVVRQESVTVVSGPALKNFGVVVGSFSLKANAEGLQGTLKSAGYDPSIVYNSERNMYRVVAASFDGKVDAVKGRNTLRAMYADAWLLFNK
ncbi:SPOR domain-containing protein [Prevotella sp.]|jgi:Cell division protein|uniref:SPOR domain-containing protein n=1 Tax=Prevotella sp. TaxID=59823 RepID=UPI003DA5B3A1